MQSLLCPYVRVPIEIVTCSLKQSFGKVKGQNGQICISELVRDADLRFSVKLKISMSYLMLQC